MRRGPPRPPATAAGSSGRWVAMGVRFRRAGALTLPKSGVAAQIVAAVVFVAFATGLIVYARAFRTVADEAAAGESAEAEAPLPPLPPGVELTPRTARDAHELFTALSRRFGDNARGVPLVTYVDYDRHPDRLHIAFALDHADPAAPGSRAASLKRVRDLLECVHDGEMPWTWVLITGTSGVRDKSDTLDESTVIRFQFAREKLRTLDWPRVTGDDLPPHAEQSWLCLDLQK